MVDAVRARPVLRDGVDGRPIDPQSLVEIIQRLSQLVTDFDAIRALELNPLMVFPDPNARTVAVDARVLVAAPSAEDTSLLDAL